MSRMPAILVLPWLRTRAPRPATALLFASRFDAVGIRQGWRLFTGGIRLWSAVLRAPGALGVSVRAHPLSGRYYTLSLWTDQQSLRAFAHGSAHRNAVARMARLGEGRGVLAARPAGSLRPSWPDTVSWLATLETGPFRHYPAASSEGEPVLSGGAGIERGPRQRRS